MKGRDRRALIEATIHLERATLELKAVWRILDNVRCNTQIIFLDGASDTITQVLASIEEELGVPGSEGGIHIPPPEKPQEPTE